jgi:hypothetical protein
MNNNSLIDQALPTIKFSQNWNKKLNCDSFTTIRKITNFYILGSHYNIMLGPEIIKECKLIEINVIRPKLLNHTMWRIDTGMSKEQSLEIIKCFYGDIPDEMYQLCFCTVQKFPTALISLLERETEKLYNDLNPKK